MSGECIEAASWRKSSRSYSNGNCAEVGQGEAGQGGAVIGIRDTKEAHLGENRTVLEFRPVALYAFIARIRAGEIGGSVDG